MQFKRLVSDPCIYVKGYSDTDSYTILTLYVDDIIIASNNEKDLQGVIKQLSARYSMKHLGNVKSILGTEIKVDKNKISMTQRKFTENLLKKYNLFDDTTFTPSLTPIDNRIKLTKEMEPSDEQERSMMKDKPYQKLVGSLLWLSINTRPDISYAVSQVYRCNNNPGIKHWNAILEY